jgi:hypothetical protein
LETTMRRVLSAFAALLMLTALVSPAYATTKPISLDSPVAGEPVPGVDPDGNAVVVNAQVVTLVDAAGAAVTAGGDASAANQTTGNSLLTTIDASLNDIEAVQEGGTLATAANQTANTTAINAARTPVTPATATATQGVLQGCEYRSTLPTFTNTQQGAVQCNAKGMPIVVMGDAAGAVVNLGTTGDAGANAVGSLITWSRGAVFNGTTWDRWRGDTNAASVLPGLSSTFWSYAAATGGIVNTTTAVTIKAAAGASVRNYVSSCTISHDALGAVTEVAIRDGAGGTVLWRGKVQTAAAEDRTISFPVPLKGTANTLLEVVTLSATVTGAVFVNCQGFTGT